MPPTEITVFRHGGRWALSDAPGAAPRAEFNTREEAEVEARRLAGETGAEIRVDENDPTGLAGVQDQPTVPDQQADPAPPGGPRAAPPDEMAREPQAGL